MRDAPFYKPRGDYDYVYVLDAHGWFYRYGHLQSIDPAIQPGARVKMGQKIGVLGKEGSSGGWAHLHFDIKAKQPSGKWGIQDAYPFLWEAYHREHKPQIVAVARPHHLIAAGETVTLDGSRSWSAAGQIARYQWTFGDGSTADGARSSAPTSKPGSYSEVLKVTDARDASTTISPSCRSSTRIRSRRSFPPTIHASYAPTFGIRAGDPVTFKVRTFRADRSATRRGTSATAARRCRFARTATPTPTPRTATPRRSTASRSRAITSSASRERDTAARKRWRIFPCAWMRNPRAAAQQVNHTLEGSLARKLLTDKVARSMMRGFLDQQLEPLPLPATREAWLVRRDAPPRNQRLDIPQLRELWPEGEVGAQP